MRDGLPQQPKALGPAHGFHPAVPVDLRSFMEQVRQKRLELGLSLADVAVQAEISVPYLCQLERGQKTNPTVQTLERLARALNVPLHMVDSAATQEQLAAGREVIRRAILHLSDHDRRKLVATTPRARLSWALKRLLGLPDVTRENVAEGLQLSLTGLDDVIHLRTGFNPAVAKRLCRQTGIPEDFFYKGLLDWSGNQQPVEWDEIQMLLRQLAVEGFSLTEVRAALMSLRQNRR